MRLLLVRHGIAAERPEHDGPDATRPLTAAGRKKTREAAAGLAALGLAPRVVLSSPLVRARETAALVAAALDVSDVRETEALEPGADPFLLLAELARLPGADPGGGRDDEEDADLVAAVGHLPHLDALIAHALAPGLPPVTSLKKAGAALLELPAVRPAGGGARLCWLLEPRQLRSLAR